MGIPTVMVSREGFSQAVGFAFAGMGFPAEAPQAEFPVDMFVPGSDLTPLKGKIEEIIAGLTTWQPKSRVKQMIAPPKIQVKGRDYEEAVANVNRLFLQKMWSDGLPIIPPTGERVAWLLTGTGLPPDKAVGKILLRGGIATVATIAVNLAMAGGRPEYMPVLIAAVEAITVPEYQLERTNATTCSVYPVVVVNGPIAKQIRLGSGYGCLGPDPLHPAGASIGRALRFLLQSAGGAVPGIGTMAVHGSPARYANIVFAEDEDGLPSGWVPLGTEQGFAPGSNVVTVYTISGTTNIPGGEAGDRPSALESLNLAAACMGIPNRNYWGEVYNPEGAAGILLIARGTAQGLSQLGWSKEAVKTYLWENSRVRAPLIPQLVRHVVNRDPMPISVSPKGIRIVVAGGSHSGQMMWLQYGCCAERPVSREIKLPAHWDELLKNAKDNLGALPGS